jgi:large subunit ribosomal protein L24
MKLQKGDNVVVITGRDKGKTGKVLSVIPKESKVVVEGINIAKRHTKPSNKVPRGGILEITKPIDASKIMVLDPASGKPARIGYIITKSGDKERIYRVSKNAVKPKTQKSEAKPATKDAAKTTKPVDQKEEKKS